jgi:hypothetical protein
MACKSDKYPSRTKWSQNKRVHVERDSKSLVRQALGRDLLSVDANNCSWW